MESNRSETQSIWWKGALKSGVKETVRGLAVGFLAAGILFGLAQFAMFAPMLGPMVGSVSFSPVLLMAFCGVISGVTGLFTGGSQAVTAYEQRKFNVGTVQALHEIDGRTRALEHVVTPARHVQKILENGSRNAASFQTAEAERAQAPKGPTIH
jgi:hypothetical protein